MTKQEMYRQLCIEQGSCTNEAMTADEWYAECSHNITPGQDDDLQLAADGDMRGLIDIRQSLGLPVLT